MRDAVAVGAACPRGRRAFCGTWLATATPAPQPVVRVRVQADVGRAAHCGPHAAACVDHAGQGLAVALCDARLLDRRRRPHALLWLRARPPLCSRLPGGAPRAHPRVRRVRCALPGGRRRRPQVAPASGARVDRAASACPLRSAQRHRVRPRCARHAQQAATGDRPARFECVRARRGGEAGPRSSRQAVGMPSIACRWLDAHAA
mmetsp:Transcript_37406/g.103266  ORF Transcript_37406/g.103266 Transcript_37406/m.103266 type:complete len:204 (+) Transcript_37406:183-794(+)